MTINCQKTEKNRKNRQIFDNFYTKEEKICIIQQRHKSLIYIEVVQMPM